MGFKVAVVGATGNVGREILSTLAERNFPVDEVVALASSGSMGREVSFGEDDILRVQALDTYDFRGVDIVLSSPGSKVSAVFAPRATKAGAVVIDNTSCFRMEPDVPLVVPEVNPEAIAQYQKRGTIANPVLPGANGLGTARELVDGELVTVILEDAAPVEAIAVPRAAVLSDQEGDYVYVVDGDDKAQQRRVQLGQSPPMIAAVTNGLREGENVIVEGIQRVRPGQIVSPGPASQAATSGFATSTGAASGGAATPPITPAPATPPAPRG